MEIKYFGDNRIFLKGKKETLWLNPKKSDLEDKNYNSRIVIFTDKENNFIKLGEEEGMVIIAGAGEYEIGGIEIMGLVGMYAINVDGVKILYLGKMEGELSEKKKEKLEEADVLLNSINEKSIEMTKKSAANYIVPVDFEAHEAEFKNFLDEYDKEEAIFVDSLRVEKDNLPEGVEVVLLKTQA